MFYKKQDPIEPVSAYVYGPDYIPPQEEADANEAVLRKSPPARLFAKLICFVLICLLVFTFLFVQFLIDGNTLFIGLSAHLCPVEEGDVIICTISDELYLTTVSIHASQLWVPVKDNRSDWIQIEQLVEKSAVFKVLWTIDLQAFA